MKPPCGLMKTLALLVKEVAPLMKSQCYANEEMNSRCLCPRRVGALLFFFMEADIWVGARAEATLRGNEYITIRCRKISTPSKDL